METEGEAVEKVGELGQLSGREGRAVVVQFGVIHHSEERRARLEQQAEQRRQWRARRVVHHVVDQLGERGAAAAVQMPQQRPDGGHKVGRVC